MRSPIPALFAISLMLSAGCIRAIASEAPLNQLILEAKDELPEGGGYATTGSANHHLNHAVSVSSDRLTVDASLATPSYCSEATYLVFLKALALLQAHRSLTLDPKTLGSLQPAGQPDGVGVWGRWNANGPGTARLFRELGLGPNFTDLSQAKPGDFLKIFWNEGIGASEHGHSVIFLGHDPKAETLTFWSSNIPGGYGTKTVSLHRIHRLLFSRLEHPESINRPLPRKDDYLSSLEHRSSTPSEMADQCGILR